MAFAQINGAKLAWQQLGESGPDVVLVHGLATNRAFWFPHAAALQDRYRVTLFDLRGHGYSERPASGYRVTDLAADILGLMDHIGIQRASLIGHSYGAAAALEAAGMAPDRVNHLGLLDARVSVLQPQMRIGDVSFRSPFEAEVERQPGIDWQAETQVGFKFLEVAARMRIAGKEPEARDDFTPFGEGKGALRAARHWIDLLENTAAHTELHEPGMPASQVAGLKTPTLLMYAQRSRCMPSGLKLHELLPQARYLTLDAGHFFPVSHQAAVLDELRRLLETPVI